MKPEKKGCKKRGEVDRLGKRVEVDREGRKKRVYFICRRQKPKHSALVNKIEGNTLSR